jgi:hypothetical protein
VRDNVKAVYIDVFNYTYQKLLDQQLIKSNLIAIRKVVTDTGTGRPTVEHRRTGEFKIEVNLRGSPGSIIEGDVVAVDI